MCLLTSIYSRCTYSQYASRTSKWPLCGLVSRRMARALGLSVYIHVQQSVKSARRAKCMYYIERVLRTWVWFWTTHNVRIWFSRSRALLASIMLSLVPIFLDADFMARCGCYALCIPVHFRARLLVLPHSHHNFLPFWRCDNETASTASALRMTKLHKCAQFICKQDILIVFL